MRVFSWSPVFSWVFSWVCVRVDLRSCVPFLSGQGDGDDRRALARVRLAHFFNEGKQKEASIGDLFRFVFQFVQTFLGDFSLEKLPLLSCFCVVFCMCLCVVVSVFVCICVCFVCLCDCVGALLRRFFRR